MTFEVAGKETKDRMGIAVGVQGGGEAPVEAFDGHSDGASGLLQDRKGKLIGKAPQGARDRSLWLQFSDGCFRALLPGAGDLETPPPLPRPDCRS